MPTLVIWGEDDKWQPLTYARRLASDIPDAGLVTIPGAGHFVTEDAPEQTAHELITFLDEAQEHTPGATASTGSG